MDISKLKEAELEQVAGGLLSKEEALTKALEHAQLTRDQLDFLKKIELDFEHGKKVYEISFYKNGVEFEYDIDADTGRILKFEKDFD